jgi:hypothetical protein
MFKLFKSLFDKQKVDIKPEKNPIEKRNHRRQLQKRKAMRGSRKTRVEYFNAHSNKCYKIPKTRRQKILNKPNNPEGYLNSYYYYRALEREKAEREKING